MTESWPGRSLPFAVRLKSLLANILCLGVWTILTIVASALVIRSKRICSFNREYIIPSAGK